jgi:SAM-dependent methyltransferase
MSEKLHCPVCNSDVDEFGPGGHARRPGVKCPVCKSNSRSRLAWLFFERMTDLPSGRRQAMLHIAPEYALARRLPQMPGLDYLSADLDPDKAMVRMDITAIDYPDASFDCIVCSHVLEHVPDDRRAMRELARVLKPAGWVLFMIPMKLERTVEDPSITDPAERDRLFGHPEHVRRYGRDFVDRLEESGFSVRQMALSDIASADEARRMGLEAGLAGNAVFRCTKRQVAQ